MFVFKICETKIISVIKCCNEIDKLMNCVIMKVQLSEQITLMGTLITFVMLEQCWYFAAIVLVISITYKREEGTKKRHSKTESKGLFVSLLIIT